jgi:hypothetical protein
MLEQPYLFNEAPKLAEDARVVLVFGVEDRLSLRPFSTTAA